MQQGETTPKSKGMGNLARTAGVIASFVLSMVAASLASPARANDQFPWLGERKIMGTNNLEAISQARTTAAYDFARVVARVEMISDGSGFCTGSRVAEDLFLTNFHCDLGCSDMQFTMGYEEGVDQGDRVSFKCKELVRKNESLDYSLYVVELPEAPVPEAQYPVLTLYKGPLTDGMPLLVAGHPSARPKEIDRSDECKLLTSSVTRTDSGRDTMKHMCDTEGGSSGSPVLDRERGYAIGLHWGGRTDEANFAISMRMILEDMQAHIPAGIYGKLTIAE